MWSFSAKFWQKKARNYFCTWHPGALKQALLASRDVIISSQFSARIRRGFFTVTDAGCPKKGFFQWKGGGNSVNEGFGEDFHRKGNSVFRGPGDSVNRHLRKFAVRGSLRGVWIQGAVNPPVFGIPSFGIPVFGIPVFGIPDSGIPVFGIPVSGRVPVWGFPYLRNPCFRNPCFRNSCFRNSHLRNFRRIHAPLNQNTP